MKVLLLELAARGRFHRGHHLPFVKGWLRERGVHVEWLRFVLEPDARAGSEDPGLCVGPQGLHRLVAAVRDAAPGFVLFNRLPSRAVTRSLRDTNGAVRIGHLQEGLCAGTAFADCGSVAIRPDLRSISGFVGLAGPADGMGSSIHDTAAPDYGWQPGNDAARTAVPLPFVLCGPECDYRRPLASNPRFSGLDLSSCGRIEGCAFCMPASELAGDEDAQVVRLERQLRAIAATHPPWPGRLAVRVIGSRLLAAIARVAETVCACAAQPLDLILDARPDVMLAAAEPVRRALQALSPSGHAIHLSFVGVESFAQEDLERLNKGTRWQDGLDVARLLLELERDFPQSFGVRRYGGLSLLLFTPWTRPQDLALNVALIRRCRIGSLCGKALSSRLRLHRSLPLFAVARRDGLLLERHDDARLDTSRRSFYDDEVPWRFGDEALGPVSRVLVRLGDDVAVPGDPLDEALAPFRTAVTGKRGTMAIAEAIVDGAIAARPGTAAELVRLLGSAQHFSGSVDRAAPRCHELSGAREHAGYRFVMPACCAQARRTSACADSGGASWDHLRLRLEQSGEVSFLLNPAPGWPLDVAPCSLSCEEAVGQARRMVELAREREGQAAYDRLVQTLRRPWLLFVDAPGCAVELVTDHPPRGRFPYRAGAARGCGALLEAVREGDDLEVDDQHVLVRARGRLRAALSGRAMLWWYREPVQEQLWRRVLALRWMKRRDDLGEEGERERAPAGASDLGSVSGFVSRVLGLASGRPVAFHGFRPHSVSLEPNGELRIVLRAPSDEVVLLAGPRHLHAHAYSLAGPLAIYHPREARIDVGGRHRAADALVRYLNEAFRRVEAARGRGQRGDRA